MKDFVFTLLALCSTLLSSAKTYTISFSTEKGLTNASLSSFISNYGETDPNNGKYCYTDSTIDNTLHGTTIQLTFTNFFVRSYFEYYTRNNRYQEFPFTLVSDYPNQGIIKINAPEGEVITKLTLVNSQATYTTDDFSRMEAEGYTINEGNTLAIEDGVKSLTIMSRIKDINNNTYNKNHLDGLIVETKEGETATVKEIENSDAIFNGTSTLKSGDKVKFKNELIAVYQNGQYAYVTSDDESHPAQSAKGVQRARDVHEGRNLLVVGDLNTTLSRDDLIAAGASGTLTTVDGTLALIPDADSFVKSKNTNAYPIKAKFITANTLGDCNIGDFVSNLDADFKQNADNNWIATDANGNNIPIENRYGLTLQPIDAAQFLGFVVDNEGTKAVAPILVDVSTSSPDVEVGNCRITTGTGFISLNGEWNTMTVFNMTGAMVAQNQSLVNCPSGHYLVIVDGNKHKIYVK